MAPATTQWKLDAHTGAKHQILRRYLQAWLPIMAYRKPRPKRVIILDGFAGPGVYSDGEEGSPLIALRALLDHPSFPSMSETRFVFVFLEADTKRFASLQEQIGRLRSEYSPWPDNVVIHPTEAMSFEAGGAWLLDRIKANGAQNAPMFSFVDPFGVSGVPLELIRQLCAHRETEAFVLYMFNTIQRFAGAENIDHHLRELFGTDEFADAAQDENRRQRLRELYPERLRQVVGFKYTLGFEMVNTGGQIYDLVYGTRSLKGLEKMKDAMWSVDPSGGFKFEDRRVGELSLFRDEDLRDPAVRQALLDAFAGAGDVKVEDINKYVLVNTPFNVGHWKGPLGQIEADGRVSIVATRSPRRRAGQFPDGTIVRIT